MQGILFTVIFNDAEIVKHAINNTLYEVIKMVLLFWIMQLYNLHVILKRTSLRNTKLKVKVWLISGRIENITFHFFYD